MAEKSGLENVVAQPENAGIDVLDCEILVGDEIVIDGEEIILKSNLEKYLTEMYGFEFKQAE